MTTMTPPTTHALPHAHRLRLMRSTRKVGELLGETPLLVETSPTSSVSTHSRSASMFTSEATSHGDSSHLARPMLLLHLPAASSSTTERTSLQSPLSPTFSLTLNSPVTPTLPVDTRRRKMAKLMRTLGENVPPELVFPTSTPKSRRRASTLSVPGSILERSSSDTHDSSSTHASASSDEPLLPTSRRQRTMYRKEQGWSGEWAGNVADMDDVVRRLRGLKK
ncbi:hypothetical protein C8R45DRAFT_1037945 [Mycena sanguinolenta]|nr:hypothetical protein C8R45DRAFT_1037945 [Mycena sanguinolenta]